MIIDSHQHFWQVGRFDYPWLSPDLGVLYRNYLPDDLRALLAAAGVERTIVVQASPSDAETDFLLDLAARHDFIAGVVGWLDLEDSAFAARLRERQRNPKFVGLRPAVEFIPDDRWLVRPRVLESLRAVAGAQVPLDLIVWPRHLGAVLEMLDRIPNLRCVVDHLAKPDVKGKHFEPWAAVMRRVAEHDSVSCKMSGLLTMADHQRWTFGDVMPYAAHVMECFGPGRVMFGSDWPVSLLASDYATTIELARRACDRADYDAVLGGNAARFYRLGVPTTPAKSTAVTQT
jgi:L-fuconolactonase